jgi:lipopolysaccharide/colanic/teichoic acid biosynthesis glycosyltransferase
MKHAAPPSRFEAPSNAFDLAVRRLRARRNVARWRLYKHAHTVSKRTLDLVVVILALLCLVPLFAVVAFLIWIADRGPVLYWQRRVGLDGVEFDFPKFRSMSTDSDALRQRLERANQHGSEGVTFKMRNDPRITRIGRFIRRFSIDELPQLWCVLRGQMSLVGPRPPLPGEVARYTLADRQRLSVKPGLTCIWQVSGRSDIPFERQVLLDMEYLRNRSLKADLLLLLKTIPAVVLGRGAY